MPEFDYDTWNVDSLNKINARSAPDSEARHGVQGRMMPGRGNILLCDVNSMHLNRYIQNPRILRRSLSPLTRLHRCTVPVLPCEP